MFKTLCLTLALALAPAPVTMSTREPAHVAIVAKPPRAPRLRMAKPGRRPKIKTGGKAYPPRGALHAVLMDGVAAARRAGDMRLAWHALLDVRSRRLHGIG